MGWIPHVLLNPDAIYADLKAFGDFAYVYNTLTNELFFIVIHEKETPKGTCYFVTAYAMTSDEWAAKRQARFTMAYPVKSASGKLGKGRKITKRKN